MDNEVLQSPKCGFFILHTKYFLIDDLDVISLSSPSWYVINIFNPSTEVALKQHLKQMEIDI